MRALIAGALVAFGACGSSGDDDPVVPDAQDAVPPALSLFPDSMTAPPGAWSDALLRIDGNAPAVGAWELSLVGLPAGVTGWFEPPVLADGARGAALRLDLATDAPPSTTFITARATSGDQVVDVRFDLTVRPYEGAPDFVVFARAPIAFDEGGTRIPVPASGVVDAELRVLSLGGFAGEVHLASSGPLLPTPIEPASVTLAAGDAADATAQLSRGREEGVSLGAIVGAHRLVSHVASSATISGITSDEPKLTFGMAPHGWVDAGASAMIGGYVQPFLLADAVELTVERADGVTASVSALPWLTVTAAPALAPGGYRVDVRATAGAYVVDSYVHVAVPPTTFAAIPGSVVLGAPVTAGGAPTFVVDSAGTELRYTTTAGWGRALSSDGFTTPAFDSSGDRRVHTGVLGGRVIVDMAAGAANVTELRSDVGTRTWFPIAGVDAQPRVAYDASNDLLVVGTSGGGVLGAWRRAANGTITPSTTGLPGGLIDAGPWLAGGAIASPVVAFVQGGRLQVYAWGGAGWGPYADLPVTALAPLEVSLVVDPAGRPVAAVRDGDGALHVWRGDGVTWTDLALPVSSTDVVLGAALARDAAGRVCAVWVEAPHVAVRPALAASGARVRISLLDGGSWATPVDVTLDPGAVPASPAVTFSPDGIHAAWTEAGAVVVIRAPLP